MNENILRKKKHEIDMCSGNLFLKILQFCIPLALMGVLNLLYNTADLIVVSNFSGDEEALGAVGSTSSLINLIVNLFMGLSVGTNVVAARYFGAKNYDGIGKIVHTTVIISFISGIALGIFGFFCCDFLLTLMNNDLELSRVYMKIYFIGLPFNLLYNFMAAILRAVGDTKRPLYFLTISGILNVLLNLLFVIVFDMSVAGVALATIISQFASCILIFITFYRTKECYQFRFRKLHIYKTELLEIIRIGLPAGIQSSLFAISNVIVQSSVNIFGTTAINGNAAAQSIEGFVWISMNSVYHAALAFTGQNVGAKRKDNIKKVTIDCLIIVTLIAVIMGGSLFLLHNQALSIYTKVPEEMEVGFIRLHYLCLPYFTCGIMDVMCGVLRGLGYSTVPTFVSILGVIGFRIGWIFAVFYPSLGEVLQYSDLNLLYVSYPISWVATFTVHTICYFIFSKRKFKEFEENALI